MYLTLKFMLLFKDSATSYFHPVSMENFYSLPEDFSGLIQRGGWEVIRLRQEKWLPLTRLKLATLQLEDRPLAKYATGTSLSVRF